MDLSRREDLDLTPNEVDLGRDGCIELPQHVSWNKDDVANVKDEVGASRARWNVRPDGMPYQMGCQIR
ncbi:unnamed protein product [Phytophthora fragariaefolia]|uniref:Unnamed protein product n=1 Tax=Phytophthora fragariaefolia TaxID=1490495 RepID=A0A9W6YBK2_9STRA|nr:unnamed protein product [Phytophthora fragariaefolia]